MTTMFLSVPYSFILKNKKKTLNTDKTHGKIYQVICLWYSSISLENTCEAGNSELAFSNPSTRQCLHS